MPTSPRGSVRAPLRLAFAVLLCAGFFAAPSALAQSHAAAIDSLGRGLSEGRPGAVVIGVWIGGEPAVHGFGAVDSTGTPPTAQTIFEIGSITKTFTGLLLADAVERGAVQPGAPVRRFLPDSLRRANSAAAPITLTHLATHRSGLPRLPSNLRASVRANPSDPYAKYDQDALYAYLKETGLSRASNAAYAYSNLGMGLLGHVLARRADTSYAALVQRRVAVPLSLPDTRIRLTPTQRGRFAQGHDATGRPAPPWHFPTLAGAGALRSTPADMLAYARAHLTASDTTALGRAMLRATAAHAPTDQQSTRIGYGWHRTTRGAHTIVWHNGGTGGFSSFIGMHPESRRAVVLLAGIADGAAVTRAGFVLMDRLVSSAAPAKP